MDSPIYNKRYRKQDNVFIIDLNVEKIKYLFDEKDPSPIRQRDLDLDVIAYLEGALQEIPKKAPIQLNIYFETLPDVLKIQKIKDSIKNYFTFERDIIAVSIKESFIKGVKALVIGLILLAIAVALHLIFEHSKSFYAKFFVEGITIVSWVSMWFPTHIFLYEWWPIIDKRAFYHRGSLMDIRILTKEMH